MGITVIGYPGSWTRTVAERRTTAARTSMTTANRFMIAAPLPGVGVRTREVLHTTSTSPKLNLAVARPALTGERRRDPAYNFRLLPGRSTFRPLAAHKRRTA